MGGSGRMQHALDSLSKALIAPRTVFFFVLFCFPPLSFTTVRHWAIRQPGEMASPPPAGSVNGHLPKVIKRLVQRRRNVKDMLKKENNAAKRAELDIRQKALKLVANAMYGCLGFVNSRFCTKQQTPRVCVQCARSAHPS